MIKNYLLSLTLLMAPIVLNIASASDIDSNLSGNPGELPNLEGKTYECVGDGIKVKAYLKSLIKMDNIIGYSGALYINDVLFDESPEVAGGDKLISTIVMREGNNWMISFFANNSLVTSVFHGEKIQGSVMGIPMLGPSVTLSCTVY
jgi:hypothetical protein